MKTVRRPTPLPLRLAPDLLTWLRVKAQENGRSMNREVEQALRRYRATEQKEASHG